MSRAGHVYFTLSYEDGRPLPSKLALNTELLRSLDRSFLGLVSTKTQQGLDVLFQKHFPRQLAWYCLSLTAVAIYGALRPLKPVVSSYVSINIRRCEMVAVVVQVVTIYSA